MTDTVRVVPFNQIILTDLGELGTRVEVASSISFSLSTQDRNRILTEDGDFIEGKSSEFTVLSVED